VYVTANARADRRIRLLKPKLKITAIYQKIVLLAAQANQKLPSYTTVCNIVRKIKPALLTLSHEGVKANRQKFELIYRRECKAPNERWQCDHTELNIYVLDIDCLIEDYFCTTTFFVTPLIDIKYKPS